MIDWSKPIRHKPSGAPAKLVHTLKGRPLSRLIVFEVADGGEVYMACKDDSPYVENIPPRREYWANLYRSEAVGVSVSGCYESKQCAARFRSNFVDYIGEPVLVHVENPEEPAPEEPKPPQDVYANVYEREDGTFSVGSLRYSTHVEAAIEGLTIVHNRGFARLVATIKLNP